MRAAVEVVLHQADQTHFGQRVDILARLSAAAVWAILAGGLLVRRGRALLHGLDQILKTLEHVLLELLRFRAGVAIQEPRGGVSHVAGRRMKFELKRFGADQFRGQLLAVGRERLLLMSHVEHRLGLATGQFALGAAEFVESQGFFDDVLLNVDQAFQRIFQPGKLLLGQIGFGLATRLGKFSLGVIQIFLRGGGIAVGFGSIPVFR